MSDQPVRPSRGTERDDGTDATADRYDGTRVAADRYDALSTWYRLAARSEAPLHRRALEMLSPGEGERLLEIGPGTGEVLVAMARAVGPGGALCGLDVSPGMLRATRDLAAVHLVADRVCCLLADGARIPVEEDAFDGILMCFALERFAAVRMPIVLAECARVLKPAGRLVVASMADRSSRTVAMRAYRWAHRAFPGFIDCRPIALVPMLTDAGFHVGRVTAFSLWGLSVDVARARLR